MSSLKFDRDFLLATDFYSQPTNCYLFFSKQALGESWGLWNFDKPNVPFRHQPTNREVLKTPF